jgi:hypothetical protein
MVRAQAVRLGTHADLLAGLGPDGAYVVAVFVLAITLATPQPWIFWTLLVLATVAFFLIAFLTRRAG